MELFLVSAFLIALWISMTFVSVWCVAVMLFLAFDSAYLKHYENTQITRMLEKRKRKLKLIKGGKRATEN